MQQFFFLLGLSLASLYVMGGCQKRQPTAPDPSLKIDAPDVQVDISREAGVNIKAPGVDIESKSDEKK